MDGVACAEFTGGLRELLSLFMALRERTGRQATIAGEMIATAQSNVEAADDDQAEATSILATGGLMARAHCLVSARVSKVLVCSG